MDIKDDEEKRMKSRNWYDDLCMWCAAMMLAGGVGVLVYGAGASIYDSIKKCAATATAKKPAKVNAATFDTTWFKKTPELSK